MKWYEYLIIYLAPIGIPTILFFLFKKYFGGLIDNAFSKEIETFKQKLEVATEEIRFDFQKKIHNYNLFIQKKFSAYEEIQRLILYAESKICSLYGLRSEPTYEEYNKDDFITLLEKNNFTKGKIEELLSYYNKRAIFIEKFRKLLRFKEMGESNISINELRNHYWLSKLYLSDEIDKETKDVIDKMTTLQIKYELLEDMPWEYRRQDSTGDEAQKLKEEIQKLVPIYIQQIKKELSVF